jgi:PPOX class probable F420-dependent enzyme
MPSIPGPARAVLDSDRLAHLVTIGPDGAPQVSCVWVGIEDDEIVFASLGPRRKLDNIARDPRVALSIETDEAGQLGLLNYLVVHGTARITEGGGPELLQRLAYVYLGPDVKFPPMDDPPPGVVVRIAPERFGGTGPWASA